MRYYQVLSAAFIGVSFAFVQPQVIRAESSTEVAKIAKQITVLIDSKNPGSGVLIKRQGNVYTVITAGHVVANKDVKYEVVTPDERRYPLSSASVKLLPGVDLAVVQFTSNNNYNVAKMGNSELFAEGSTAYVAGFPLTTGAISRSIYNFTDGKITANASKALRDGYALVYSNNTLPGMSGGPVLNEQGELVGVHGRGDESVNFQESNINTNIRFKSGFNLGIPINTGLKLLSKVGLDLGVRIPETQVAAAPKADDYFIQGLDKYKKGDIQGAITSYTEAIKINPKYAPAYYRRAEARTANSQDAQKAQEDIQKAAELFFAQGNKAEGYRSQAGISIGQEDYKAAIVPLTKIIEINRNDAEAYFMRGVSRFIIGDKKTGLVDLNEAVRIDPNNGDALAYRGVIRSALGDRQGGIDDSNRAIRLSPNYIAYATRGIARFILGDKQGAFADLNETVRLAPKYAEAYFFRGRIRSEQGEKQAALTDYNLAVSLKPKYADAYAYRGLLRFDLGDPEGATSDVNKAIAYVTNDAERYLYQGLASALKKDKPGALANLQRAAEVYKQQGKTEEYQQALELIRKLQ